MRIFARERKTEKRTTAMDELKKDDERDAMRVRVCIRFVLSLVLVLTYGVKTRHFEGSAADVF